MTRAAHFTRAAVCALLVAATPMSVFAGQKPLPADPWGEAGRRLAAGQGEGSLDLLARVAAIDPSNPRGHFLLGLAYQQASGAGPDGVERDELALVGFDAARRLSPGDFWAVAFSGRAAFERGRYAEAAERFAEAAMLAPEDPRPFGALAAAAYRQGDMPLARLAAERAAALDPASATHARMAALAAAGCGDAAAARRWTDLYRTLGGAEPALDTRAAGLVRLAAIDAADPGVAGPAATPPASPDQVSVDVAIILSQSTHREHVGVNLLDGLKLQYGYNNTSTSTSGGGLSSFARTITETISTPQLTYSLNLFNRTGQYYQVVARPTLTAFKGETSEFFVGRSVLVQVSGVNTAELRQIDVGVSMKLTPMELDGDKVKLRVETGRSFVNGDTTGSFAESLNTFRQTVAATAEVRFGETLILSGLSESVNDSSRSKTPLLGDVPGVGLLFSDRSNLERRDAVLVLVTPAKPTTFAGQPWARPAAVQRLINLWSRVIDPGSNAADVTERLSRTRLLRAAAPGDAPLMWPDARKDAAAAVAAHQ